MSCLQFYGLGGNGSTHCGGAGACFFHYDENSYTWKKSSHVGSDAHDGKSTKMEAELKALCSGLEKVFYTKDGKYEEMPLVIESDCVEVMKLLMQGGQSRSAAANALSKDEKEYLADANKWLQKVGKDRKRSVTFQIIPKRDNQEASYLAHQGAYNH